MNDTDTQNKTPSWAKRKPLTKAQVVEQLKILAGTAYACARTTTEPAVRAGYMDRAHVLREALRLL